MNPEHLDKQTEECQGSEVSDILMEEGRCLMYQGKSSHGIYL